MGVGKSTFAFSASSITIDGGSTSIGITRDNQSYSHKLLHGYGDIATLAVGTTSYTWTPTASALTEFFEEVPAQKSRLIDVYLDTYNGSTKVGRDVHALAVTLSEATGKPTVSNFAISDSNSVTNGLGIIIDGKSTLTASATPTAKYGATISRNVFTCTHGGKTYESYYINDLIASLPLTTTPTAFTIGYESTDSRGFSNTATLSKTVAKYQAPDIDTFEVIRCDASGNEDEDGAKAKIIIQGSWAAMNVGTAYKNAATLKVGYKAKSATDYTYQTISVSAGTIDISQLLSATLTAGTEYEFSVELKDGLGVSDTRTGVGCSNVANILYVSADGKELVIGSDTGNNVMIDSDSVDIRSGSTVLSTFTENSIELGKNSIESTVYLCGYRAKIAYDTERQYLYFKSPSLYFGPKAPSESGSSAVSHAYIDNDKIDITSGELSINSSPVSDFVIQQGKSGTYTYRIWKSGIKEAWINIILAVNGNSGNAYRFNLPWTTSDGMLTVLVTQTNFDCDWTVDGYNAIGYMTNNHDTTGFTLNIWNSNSYWVNCGYCLYAINRLGY